MQYFECTLTQVLCCTAGLTSFCHEAAHQSCSVLQGWVRILSSHRHLPRAEQLLGPFIASLQNTDKPVVQLNLRCKGKSHPQSCGYPAVAEMCPGAHPSHACCRGSRALLLCPGCRVWGGIPACFNQPLKAPACNKLLMPAFCSSITLKLLGTKLLMYLPEFMQIY